MNRIKALRSLPKVLVQVLNRFAPARPSIGDGFCAPFERPWDIRTIILPISGTQGPMLFFSNLFAGRVGVRGFYDVPRASQDPVDEGNLILFVATTEGSVARTIPFSRSRDSVFCGNGVELQHPEIRYRSRGAWPNYEIQVSAPKDDIELKVSVRSQPPLHWWAYAGAIYRHYSDMGKATGSLRVGKKTHTFESWISLERGQGSSLQRLPGSPAVSLSLFHYELGSLTGRGIFALGKVSILGGHLEALRSGFFIDTKGRRFPISDWNLEYPVVEHIPDRCGGKIQVPRQWSVTANGPGIRLAYNSVEDWRTFAGVGRLCSGGALISGRVDVEGLPSKGADGVVYQEHLHHGRTIW